MRPHGKYSRVSPTDPEALGQCDRCSFWYNLRDLKFQYEWSGTHLYSLGILVCDRCLDVPQEQLRTILIPADPVPVLNARVPNFAYEEQTARLTEFNAPKNPPWGAGPQMLRCLQNGETVRILQYITSI